jgi:F-type H+-transporting ATPase subunit b
MPQLDPSTFSPQLVWLAITFVLLYILMRKLLIPKIGGAIENRRAHIAGDLDRASALKAETERAIASYEEAIAQARGKAHAIASEIEAALAADAAAERARIDAEMAEKVAAAEQRIAATKAAALREVKAVAGEVAGEIVARLTGGEASTAEIAAALAEAEAR